MLVDEATLIINETTVEVLDSHSIHILNNLHLGTKNTEVYNTVVGNVPEYYNPLVGSSYPHADSRPDTTDEQICSINRIHMSYSESPTIKRAELHTPLPFFFHRRKRCESFLLCSVLYLTIKLIPPGPLGSAQTKRSFLPCL